MWNMIIEFMAAFVHRSRSRSPIAIDIITRASLDTRSVEDADRDFEDQLRDEGFPEGGIDELIAVGFFSVMMNMLTDTRDMPWETPFPP